MTHTIETPVLIVGAGPVGLGLALDLGKRHTPCTIIEMTDGVIVQPKIGLMAIRTMEIFRQWGIDESVKNAGFPGDYKLSMVFCTSLCGHLLDKEEYPSLNDMETPVWSTHKKQRCPQIWLNPIMQAAAEKQSSINLKLRWKLENFQQYDDHVESHITDLSCNENVVIRSKYLIACDGIGSSIRNALGIEMKGNPKLSYSISILVRLPGLLQQIDKGQAERYIFVGEDGTWGNWTVINGTDLWRMTILGSEEKLDLKNFNADQWIKKGLGRDDIPFEILSILPWRRSELIAESYGDRRVILAGDAAHTMSPTGGMGMNTGMGDAFDLGWKIDAVVKGWAGPNLLGSYEAERRPIAIRNAKFSTHNWNAWLSAKNCKNLLEDTIEAAQLRAEIGSQLKEATKTDWESWGLQMGYVYQNSNICVYDDSAPPPDDYIKYIPSSYPGARAPHAWLADGRSTLDLYGDGFVLLSFSEKLAEETLNIKKIAVDLGIPFSVVQLNSSEIYKIYEFTLVLVRPDGHVCWRGEHIENPEMLLKKIAGF